MASVFTDLQYIDTANDSSKSALMILDRNGSIPTFEL
jgi:hypothetical protein